MTVDGSHVNQELDGLIDVVVASAQSAHDLILRACDPVDVQLRGPCIRVIPAPFLAGPCAVSDIGLGEEATGDTGAGVV
jgi:hypothetical protein